MAIAPRELSFSAPSLRHPEQFHRTTVYEWGDTDNPDILVCVHGLTRNGRDFDFLAERLSDTYRILSPDIVGRGKSERLQDPMDYTYPQYMADLLVMLQALDVPACNWVGTSMGGILGMMIATFHPDKIQRLILNDIGAVVAKQGLDRIASYAGITMDFPDRQTAEEALRRIFTPFGVNGDAQWAHLFEYTLKQNAQGGFSFTYDPDITAPFKAETKNYQEVKAVELWPLWKGIHCPVLVIRGAESDILLRETVEEMRKLHPQTTVTEIAGVGHAPTLFEPEQIDIIQNWFKATSPANTTAKIRPMLLKLRYIILLLAGKLLRKLGQ